MHTFNVGFYAAVATVIPLFYLALTLQGSTYENLMARWRLMAKEAPDRFWPQVKVNLIASLAIVLAAIILGSVCAECLALYALYMEKSTPHTQLFVFISTLVLVIATVIGPFYRFVTVYVVTLVEGYREGERKRVERKRAKQAARAARAAENRVAQGRFLELCHGLAALGLPLPPGLLPVRIGDGVQGLAHDSRTFAGVRGSSPG